MWCWNFPLKIKCFVWLALKNIILTWDNLVSRVWYGPSCCWLCHSEEETIQHIFLECSLTISIFEALKNIYHFSLPDSTESLVEFLDYWMIPNPTLYYIPFFVFWCVWNARNKGILEDKRISLATLMSKVDFYIHSFPVPVKKKKVGNIGLAPLLVYPVGFFNGATADGKGGAGIYLAFNSDPHFHINLGCGLSTNTMAELLALWALLYWETALGLPSLHIFGDSSVIII